MLNAAVTNPPLDLIASSPTLHIPANRLHDGEADSITLERLPSGRGKRRGRPPAWMAVVKKRRGRPPGSKNKSKAGAA